MMPCRILCTEARLFTLLVISVTTLCHSFPTYQEKFFNQTLDHFHPESKATWLQRYLYNDIHWTGSGRLSNGCRGPILFYTGNEGDITDFWDVNGFMIKTLAPKWGALLVFAEARYYGKSLPFGEASYTTENFVYLSTEQILEDYVQLLNFLKKSVRAAHNCPVVAFGGSYGGTLTTFLRLAYPSVVVGGLASSAPIGYYDKDGWSAHNVTEYTWSDIATGNYAKENPRCLDAIKAASIAIDAAPAREVVDAFHVCSAAALGPSVPSELFAYALESLPQMNYPYPIGSRPAWPVREVCDIMVAAGDSAAELIRAAANVTDTFFGWDGKNCLPALSEGPGGVPGDGPGPGPWGWQSCTENLHEFSARGLRNYTFDIERSARAPCRELFNGTVTPATSALADRFGGYKIPFSGVTNLIWSNGGLDPWHGGGFLPWGFPNASGSEALSNHRIFMPNAAHHLDLRGPHPDDPPDVTNARILEEKLIAGWIAEASKKESLSLAVE